MGRGKRLTEEERGRILAYRECGYTYAQIAEKLQRSTHVVSNFLDESKPYGSMKHTGRPSTVSDRAKREIFRLATARNLHASQIKHELELQITPRRICQLLAANPNACWTKPMKKPALKPHHKVARMAFATKYVDYGAKWKEVIFSDEKKWNLDGPDGVHYYWHDLRKEKTVKMSRNFGGGSLMVWGGFSFAGNLPIAWISTRMNSEDYINLLDVSLLSHAEDLMDGIFTFQQDNASIHKSVATMSWLQSKQIPVLDWPACSPDLNPIENIWGWLTRKVYANGRQFDNVNELKDAIRKEWEEMPLHYTQKLVLSMKNRLIEVIRTNGGQTKY